MISADTRRQGFTLAETLVVTGIIAIAATGAILAVRNQRPSYLFDRQVRTLHADLCAARMRAIGGNCPVTVTFSSSPASYTIWTDADADGQKDGGETLVTRLDPDLGIRLSAAPVEGRFTPSGRFDANRKACLIGLVSARGRLSEMTILQSGHVMMGKTALTEDK